MDSEKNKEKEKENEHEHLYNSVYLKDEGGHPTWALKKYEQQCPLSYHYINKKTLDYEKDEYGIL
jgi:hypothetical protein